MEFCIGTLGMIIQDVELHFEIWGIPKGFSRQ